MKHLVLPILLIVLWFPTHGQSFEQPERADGFPSPLQTRVYNSKDITINDVYPNPVSDHAIIEYTMHAEHSKAKVVIHNILGKIMLDYDLPPAENKIRISTDDLASGVYFYTVYLNNDGILTKKLIVRK